MYKFKKILSKTVSRGHVGVGDMWVSGTCGCRGHVGVGDMCAGGPVGVGDMWVRGTWGCQGHVGVGDMRVSGTCILGDLCAWFRSYCPNKYPVEQTIRSRPQLSHYLWEAHTSVNVCSTCTQLDTLGLPTHHCYEIFPDFFQNYSVVGHS